MMTKLTPAERAILIGQYRILGALEGDPDSYEEVITVLDRGYEAEYDQYLSASKPMSKERTDFVRNIMWLYYLIKLAKNKEALDAPGGDRAPDGRLRLENFEPKFPGFDGNNDPELLGYANFLIKHGQYVEHNHYLNSHGREPDYEAMLDLWRSWGKPIDLTEAQADELLDIH
jgi:uncharacterized protein YfbU (UPF0304 family)